MNYPEHIKLKAIQSYSQKVKDFLDWMEETKGIRLGEGGDNWGRLNVYLGSHDSLLAEFFEIDQKALEREKRQMLSAIQQMNEV